MPSYRCYFLDGNDRIAGPAEIIEAEVIGEAIDRALAILAGRPWHRGVELWDGGMRVYPSSPVTDTD